MDYHPTSISTGTIIRFFAVAVFIVTAYYLLDVILVVLAAVVIASAFEPIVRRLGRYGLNHTVSVISIYLIIALVLAGLSIFFLPSVLKETTEFLSNLPQTISIQELWSPIDSGAVGDAETSDRGTIYISDFINGLQSIVVGAGKDGFQTITTIFGGILSFIMILVLSFYLLVKKDGIDEFLHIVTPVRHHEYIIHLWKRSQRKMALWLQGQAILGLIVGILVYTALTIVGIKHAMLLAIFAAALEIIPIFGPIIAAVPAGLVAYSAYGIGTSLLIIGIYIIIQQVENHLLYPLVVRKVVGISPIVVILAVLVGAKLAGVLGALVAVPLSAAFMEYINDIEKSKNQVAGKI